MTCNVRSFDYVPNYFTVVLHEPIDGEIDALTDGMIDGVIDRDTYGVIAEVIVRVTNGVLAR